MQLQPMKCLKLNRNSFLFQIQDDDLGNNKLIKLLQILEKVLEKYDIEPTLCSQRLICTLSKRSAENVANGNGSSTDKILDGIFRFVIVTLLLSVVFTLHFRFSLSAQSGFCTRWQVLPSMMQSELQNMWMIVTENTTDANWRVWV